MAIEDYIPNIFGGVPTGYQGLLGQEQASALSKRANLAGLLGFGSALAQGMSPQGYRRSAFENILSAASAGFGGAGQAYESGLKNIISQQQLALQQRQVAGIQAMKQKYPDLADEFDTNPAGAFRLVAEREQAKTKPITVGEGQTVISPSGQVLFSAPGAKKKSTAVVGNTVVDLETGQPIYTAPEKPQGKILTNQEASALGLPPNIVYQQSATGEIKPVEGTGAKAPEIKDFADGTTRQYDAATQSWKVVARKPAGEGKTMYESKPTVDAQGRLVFLPTRPGMPVVDAQTGKPVDGFMPKTEAKPLPPALQKAEEEDYDLGTAAANLAKDANKYVTSIINGTIPFGLKEKASIAVRSALGSSDPDVVARNDFNRWKTEYTNESLRLNKGTQTEGDAIRAGKELESAESPADAAKAIIRLRDLNARRAGDYQTSINRRRTNAKLGEAEVKLEVPKFEPYVFTDADYRAIPNGATYIDSKGVRRVKGKR
jgi:hypothetical protein